MCCLIIVLFVSLSCVFSCWLSVFASFGLLDFFHCCNCTAFCSLQVFFKYVFINSNLNLTCLKPHAVSNWLYIKTK